MSEEHGHPNGLAIRAADPGEVSAVLAAVTGTDPVVPVTGTGARYLFAAYQHGYDIAYLDGARWQWGSHAYHGAGRPASGPEHGLEQVRIYGRDTELLITRLGQDWHGSWRTPTPQPTEHAWLRSRQRSYLVSTGKAVTHERGFTRVEHGSGQFAVLPYRFAPGRHGYAQTREYFAADPETGAVRVAAVTWTGYSSKAPRPVDNADAR
ncbi:CRISPR-associated protein Csx19 [Nocardia sp. NBC_01377]|uniref:type III-D CRISPR-associated protein Csx19 n=1 Tax=Nocardia sp. NBC_01377 TaxID=2903595 RepID=UPI0032448284